MKLLITQPTFLHWIGYFDMIDYCDEIVFLDDVQFERRSWQQRNKIRTKDGLEWLTVPIKNKNLREQKIYETIIDINSLENEKILSKIQHNYSKAKYFKDYWPEFKVIFSNSLNNSKLIELNTKLISWFLTKLKINKQCHLSSSFNILGEKSMKLINICKLLKSEEYVSTIGASNYIKNYGELFKKNNIQVYFHNYIHPEYKQCSEPFIPYASILDLLFNEGVNSLSKLKSGRKNFIKL